MRLRLSLDRACGFGSLMGNFCEALLGNSRGGGNLLSQVMKILDRLIGALRGCCHSLPDLRQGGDARYTMTDVGVFPVLPAEPVVPGAPASSGGGTGALELPNAVRPDRDLRSQVSLGLWTSVRFAPRCASGAPSFVPSDNHIRALLDPVSPDHFHPVFAEVVAELEGAWRLSGSLAATC
jgi:hypothetical protein